MINSGWQAHSEGTAIFREQGQFKQPCRNERHNLFTSVAYSGPRGSLHPIETDSLLQIRVCLRCGRVQHRYLVPDNEDDVIELTRMADTFESDDFKADVVSYQVLRQLCHEADPAMVGP